MVWRTREASRPPRAHQDTPPNPTPQGGGRGLPTHPTPQERRESLPTHKTPTPQGGGGRGIPTHNTPHHRERRREGDSHRDPTPQGEKGFPINPTTTQHHRRGGLPRPFGGVWGGRAAERVTIYRSSYCRPCRVLHIAVKKSKSGSVVQPTLSRSPVYAQCARESLSAKFPNHVRLPRHPVSAYMFTTYLPFPGVP